MPEKTEDAYRLTVPLSRGLLDEMEVFIEDDPQFTGKAGLARTGITQILQGNSSSGTAEVGRLEDQISDLNGAVQSLQNQMDDIQVAIVDNKIEFEGPAEKIQSSPAMSSRYYRQRSTMSWNGSDTKILPTRLARTPTR